MTVPLDRSHARNLQDKLTFMGERIVDCTELGVVDGEQCWKVSLNDLGKQVTDECADILKEARDFESR
jgi:hypothetical protein